MAARTVGFLHNGTKGSFQKQYAAFLRRLHDFVEEGDVRVRERWAGDDTSKTLEQHAKDLVDAGVQVLVAAGGPPSALAAQKAAGGKTPVVFMSVTDPVGLGLVKDIDEPGGNLTGIAGLTSELDITRLEILHELLGEKKGARIGILNNSKRPKLEEQYATLAAAAAGLNVTPVRMDASSLAEIENAFASFKGGQKVEAVLVTADSMFNNLRKQVVRFAAAAGLPAIYQWREFPEAGGLMSFGPNILDAYAQVGEYAGHILDGIEPDDLPVALPDRLELVVNLRTAYSQKVRIPASLLTRAEFVKGRTRTRKSRALNYGTAK